MGDFDFFWCTPLNGQAMPLFNQFYYHLNENEIIIYQENNNEIL